MKPVFTKIMVFGTFDGVHKGHLNFFKQAKSLAKNSYLIVSIARDKNVLRIKKNLPLFSERKRLNLVKKTLIPDLVVLGGLDDYFDHIIKNKPDIIALGYDQKEYVDELKKDLKSKGFGIKIIRLKAYKKSIYKNSLLKKDRFI
jgi:FAD synthetase